VLTSEGEKLQKLAERYLRYQHELFQKDPEKDMVAGHEVTEALGLDSSEVVLLGQLVNGRNNSWDAAARRDPNWSVQVMAESELWEDLDKALEDWIMPHYRPESAVFQEDRRREMDAYSAKRSPSLTDFVSSPFIEERKVRNTAEDDRLKRRYQVFVSSTFQDLEKEHEHVLRALLELNCIPSGMEIFPAANDTKWDLIQRLIDDCDYFVVVVAGKYGSLAQNGKSFTESEYDYALLKGKPVIGFYYSDVGKLPAEKVESSYVGRQKLASFTEKVKAIRSCRTWNSPEGLASALKSAIWHAVGTDPKPGWVRADTVPNWGHVNQLESRIAELEGRKETKSTASS